LENAGEGCGAGEDSSYGGGCVKALDRGFARLKTIDLDFKRYTGAQRRVCISILGFGQTIRYATALSVASALAPSQSKSDLAFRPEIPKA
jgi:hypothetical protein